MDYNKLEKTIFERLAEESREDTRNLLRTAYRISAGENVGWKELLLLKTAILYYYLDKELLSERKIEVELSEFGYDTEQIDIIKNILYTNPKKAKTDLEKIMCDTTTEAMGKEDFLEKLESLRIESLKMREITNEVPEKSEQWYIKALRELEKHKYFTETAKKKLKLEEGKEENIKKLKELLRY